jgi:hypothetical protein
MGSNACRQGRHAESPPGAIQHAMVGKLRPEVKDLRHLMACIAATHLGGLNLFAIQPLKPDRG